MSISIHELLAVARESEGVKAVQGDAMLCEKRFAPDTRYMVEFLVLKQTEKFEEAGIYHRYFLTKKAYYEMIELQTGSCFGRNTALSSCPNIFSRPGVGRTTGWKEENACRGAPLGARALSTEILHRTEKKGVVSDGHWNRPWILCHQNKAGVFPHRDHPV